MTPLDVRFAKKLEELIVEQLNTKSIHLSEGNTLIREDAAASGMGTARVVGEIAGLRLARELMKTVSEELSGKKKGD